MTETDSNSSPVLGFLKNRTEKKMKLSNQSALRDFTLLFCILLVGSGMILGVFFSFRLRRLIVKEEFFMPVVAPTLTPPCSSSSTSSPLTSLCNSSWNSSSTLSRRGFDEWLGPSRLSHNMSDVELMWRASMVPRVTEYPYRRVPKVAFMFLTRGELPLREVWERFFQGFEGLFSIYLHCRPGYDAEPPESSVFYRRRIPSQAVEWGRITMIDGERRLLANALLDFSNERFVLISETCIPLFNFSTTYHYLLNSNTSFIGSFDDPRACGRGRYNKRMWPEVSLSDWRKGSQWFEVHRKLAVEIISDQKFYPIFREHCKPPCYVDEHYLPTLVTKLYQELNSNRSLTWVDWSRGGSHPATFGRKDISVEFFNRIRYGSNCRYNGESTSVCVLFARKMAPNTLEPLLQIAPQWLN